jgi:hypothetical protein
MTTAIAVRTTVITGALDAVRLRIFGLPRAFGAAGAW